MRMRYVWYEGVGLRQLEHVRGRIYKRSSAENLTNSTSYIYSNKMAKLVEMVKSSPLVRRRTYDVLDTENRDPFVQGIHFNAHFVASIEVKSKRDCPEVQQKVKDGYEFTQKTKKSLRKVVITVKSNMVSVKDTGSKITDDYPICLVAYCGAHTELEDVFFFIHKTNIDKAMFAEIYKMSDASKVKALTLTTAKAFNIAYKGWISTQSKKERISNKGCESPSVQRKASGHSLQKMAPGLATSSVGGSFTPPAPRREDPIVKEAARKRRGSFDDNLIKFQIGAKINPAVVRVKAQNERTGSTHDVSLTDDFDLEFQQLAESRSRPDLLSTDLSSDQTDNFNLDSIKAYIDSINGAPGEPVQPINEPVDD